MSEEVRGNFITLHRKLKQWEWYQDSKMVHLFIHLLLEANWKPSKWRGETIPRGSLLTGRKKLADDTGISEQSIRTCLTRLKSTNEITIKSTNSFSVISIVNYETYQDKRDGANQDINQQSNQRLTSNQPAINQRLTTSNKNKQLNKGNKGNNITQKFNSNGKKKYLDWVYLDSKQLDSVKNYYVKRGLGPDELEEAIRELDTWFENNPKMRAKRTDDAKTLKGWPLNNALKRKRELIYLNEAERRN